MLGYWMWLSHLILIGQQDRAIWTINERIERQQTEVIAGQIAQVVHALENYLDQNHRSDLGEIDAAALTLPPSLAEVVLPSFALFKDQQAVYLWISDERPGLAQALQAHFLITHTSRSSQIMLYLVGHNHAGQWVPVGHSPEPSQTPIQLPTEIPNGVLVVRLPCAVPH